MTSLDHLAKIHLHLILSDRHSKLILISSYRFKFLESSWVKLDRRHLYHDVQLRKHGVIWSSFGRLHHHFEGLARLVQIFHALYQKFVKDT
jgi:hypothetical protein